MTVFDSDGTKRFSEKLTSGGATGRSWPEQISSHTESKGIRDSRIQTGDRVVFTDGKLRPCNGCRGNLNDAAVAKKLDIEYHWSDPKTGRLRSWFTTPKKAAKTIARRLGRLGRLGKGQCLE
jgi:hypothetical protein